MNSDKEMNLDNEKATESDNLHPIFTKDPGEWLTFVNNEVEIFTDDGQKHTGYVYTIDPVSESIVLLNNFNADNPDSLSAKILMGPSVKTIRITSQGSSSNCQFFDKLFRPAVGGNMTEEEAQSKLLRLQSWFEQNRLPVSVTGDVLTVAGALTIHPPYTLDCCMSTNEIILARIQELIKNMPSSQ